MSYILQWCSWLHAGIRPRYTIYWLSKFNRKHEGHASIFHASQWVKAKAFYFICAPCLQRLSVSLEQNYDNGVFPKLNGNSVNLANSGNQINHWNMNWGSCLSHVSSWCCGSILVSYTRGGRFEPFYCNDKYFCHWIRWIQWKHLGKTQIVSIVFFTTLKKR